LAEHHPKRITSLHMSYREMRVVCSNRARADEDRIAFGAQTMPIGPGLNACDPL
jgi:hypothetical protein